jgi:hypothetical protein
VARWVTRCCVGLGLGVSVVGETDGSGLVTGALTLGESDGHSVGVAGPPAASGEALQAARMAHPARMSAILRTCIGSPFVVALIADIQTRVRLAWFTTAHSVTWVTLSKHTNSAGCGRSWCR